MRHIQDREDKELPFSPTENLTHQHSFTDNGIKEYTHSFDADGSLKYSTHYRQDFGKNPRIDYIVRYNNGLMVGINHYHPLFQHLKRSDFCNESQNL